MRNTWLLLLITGAATLQTATPAAFGTRSEAYPFNRVTGKPVLTARPMPKTLEEKSVERNFFEVKGANHETIVGIAEPNVFEFFEKRSHRP